MHALASKVTLPAGMPVLTDLSGIKRALDGVEGADARHQARPGRRQRRDHAQIHHVEGVIQLPRLQHTTNEVSCKRI